jgi:Ni,Fe-hydrogenase I small subunit
VRVPARDADDAVGGGRREVAERHRADFKGTIGGRTALDIAREVCGNAYATLAIGTRAAFGGIPAAAGGLTGAVGVDRADLRAATLDALARANRTL